MQIAETAQPEKSEPTNRARLNLFSVRSKLVALFAAAVIVTGSAFGVQSYLEASGSKKQATNKNMVALATAKQQALFRLFCVDRTGSSVCQHQPQHRSCTERFPHRLAERARRQKSRPSESLYRG